MQAFIDRHGQKHRQGEQMANRYIEGKADEAWRGLRSANNIQSA